jgi:hypothetical protein
MVGRNMLLKNPLTTLEIDPGTIRLVAQRLNHYTTPDPYKHQVLHGIGEGVTTTFLDILISWHPDKSIGHCAHRKSTHTDTYKPC